MYQCTREENRVEFMQPLPGKTKLIILYIEDIVQMCKKINAHVETYNVIHIYVCVCVYIYESCHTVNRIDRNTIF